MKGQLKILVVRQDRLGDLLMTLPSLLYLRGAFPDAKLHFQCQETYHELLKGFCREHQIELKTVTEENYDGALFLMGSAHECWQLVSRGVPIRVGIYSKPYSFMFLNYGLRQKRSASGKSEAESNLELAELLARRLGVNRKAEIQKSLLPLNEPSRKKAIELLASLQIEPSALAIFHPGMRGSALNLSVESYLDLMNEMESRGLKVALSVGPEKQDLEMKAYLIKKKPYVPVISHLTLPELAECFRLAQWVIAPSTGPLHLAHWVGAPTVALFSPVRSQHPKRWAPQGGNLAPRVLLPKVDCPASTECLGSKCSSFDCMKKTDWRSLFLSSEQEG